MVSKTEGRVEQVETNLTGVREDVRKLEAWFQEMTETLARIEAQGRTVMAEASPSQTTYVENQEEGSNVNWVGEKDGKKFRKLQLPIFEKENPLGWIFKVERYFAVNEISEAERLQVAGVSTVTVFREEFEKVSESMKEASDGMLFGAQTLREIMKTAQKVEDRNSAEEVQAIN
ncbi:hypothetical protein KY290_031627 [Solanum tuberosum]|uniref:Uncharacterized protein n=1 Tax=Solanum tuberosum TaxID=4113 RepID=A0ABQ7U9R9_SOLTU|nr:hypothetical protein KY290_031627 [Solanum tuberosum]